MEENFTKWIEMVLRFWHKAQRKSIAFFLCSAIKVERFTVAEVGQYAAATTNILPRNGAKRAYRLIHNERITKDKMIATTIANFTRYIEKCKSVTLAIDWTTFHQNFMVGSVCLITGYQRGVPIASVSYEKGRLGECESQNKFEEEVLLKVIHAIPPDKTITLLADRGFDRAGLVSFLSGFPHVRYIIRVKRDKYIFKGKKEIALDGALKRGELKNFGAIEYTKAHRIPARCVGQWKRTSDEPVILVTNMRREHSKTILEKYKERWDIESMFKSIKNEDVGYGLRKVRLHSAERWLRLFFLVTLLLQFLWEISEEHRDNPETDKAFTLARHSKNRRRYKRRSFSVYCLSMRLLRNNYISVAVTDNDILIEIRIRQKSGNY